MAPSVDSSRREVRAKTAAVDQQVSPLETDQESESSVDVAAVVNEVMQSSYGNTVVQAALGGTESSDLGQAIAGEIAAAAAGMGSMSPDGAALSSVGNAALAKVATRAQGAELTQAQALNELRGSTGQSLPDGVRGRMERAFGRNFSGVRVHTGGRSSAAADSLNAQAVALGSHIHFAEGQFAPGTTAGDAVIAHELTHVVQAAEGRLPTTGGVSDPSMSAEREAYGNESITTGLSASDSGGGMDLGTDLAGVVMASSVDTAISPSAFALPGLSVGAGSLGVGAMGMGVGMGSGIAAAGPSVGGGSMAAAPSAAPSSAPAMLRENPSDKEAKRVTDREASVQQEVEMGLDMGIRRAVDSSKGKQSVNIPKEGTGRREGVMSAPAMGGHLAANEYMDVMKRIGPDGKATRSASDDNIRAPAPHTQSANDGHAHLDGSPKRGAAPEGADRKTPLPPPSPSSEKNAVAPVGVDAASGQEAPQSMDEAKNLPESGEDKTARSQIQKTLGAEGEKLRTGAKAKQASNIQGMTNGEKYDALANIAANGGGFGDLSGQYGPDRAKVLQQEYVDLVQTASFESDPQQAIDAASNMTDPKARAAKMEELYEALPEGKREQFAKHFPDKS